MYAIPEQLIPYFVAAVILLVSMVISVFMGKVKMFNGSALLAETFRHEIIKRVETERIRIASDLHDGAQQKLISVARGIESFLVSNDKRALITAKEEIANGTIELKRIVRDLVPPEIETDGLKAALTNLIKSHLHDILTTEKLDPVDLPLDEQVQLYRVFQEAINNINKHSCATSAEFVLENCRTGIKGKISDNGIGMVNKQTGFGIQSMKQRIEALGGSLVVMGNNSGTVISFIINGVKDGNQ